MLIYIMQIVVITLLSIILLYNQKHIKIFGIIVFLILAIIAGLRSYEVGNDTLQYVIAYKKVSNIAVTEFSQLRYEYGFTFLCKILNCCTNNYQILIFITSLFVNFSVIKFIINNSKNIYLSVMMYILLNIYFLYTSAMRQAIAISIILLGFKYLKENKYLKFSIFVLVACLFHQSAILSLIFIVIKKAKYNKNFIYKLSIIFVLCFTFGKKIFEILTIFSPRLLEYATGQFYVENYFGALLYYVVHFSLFLLGFIVMLKNNKNILYDSKDEMNCYIGILAMASIFNLLTMRVSIFNRFSPYFSFFIIIFLPNVICNITNKKIRIIMYLGIFVLLMGYWVVISLYRPEWYGMVPYKFF